MISKSMAGYGYPDKKPDMSDYQIGGDAAAQLMPVLLVRCSKKVWHADLGVDPIQGVWIARLGSRRMVLRWFGETLLILRPVSRNAKPNPSFSCAKKLNLSERTICAYYALSTFDNSIAVAYQQLLKHAKETGQNTDSSTEEQAIWIKSRNSCGANQDCLVKSMRARLNSIASKIQT